MTAGVSCLQLGATDKTAKQHQDLRVTADNYATVPWAEVARHLSRTQKSRLLIQLKSHHHPRSSTCIKGVCNKAPQSHGRIPCHKERWNKWPPSQHYRAPQTSRETKQDKATWKCMPHINTLTIVGLKHLGLSQNGVRSSRSLICAAQQRYFVKLWLQHKFINRLRS